MRKSHETRTTDCPHKLTISPITPAPTRTSTPKVKSDINNLSPSPSPPSHPRSIPHAPFVKSARTHYTADVSKSHSQHDSHPPVHPRLCVAYYTLCARVRVSAIPEPGMTALVVLYVHTSSARVPGSHGGLRACMYCTVPDVTGWAVARSAAAADVLGSGADVMCSPPEARMQAVYIRVECVHGWGRR